ncbi:peptidase family m1 domain-containing protein [Ditylenchus destructor]|nr:peptidase family m1 domain-containing protein [Ditylenchus destructor]
MISNIFVVLLFLSNADAIFPKSSSYDREISSLPALSTPVPKYRLSKDLEPTSYELRVKTYVPGYVEFDESKNFTFDGQVIIRFKVLNETDKIELFSKNLKLNEAKLSHATKPEKLRIEGNVTHSDTDKVVFVVNKNMTVHEEYILEIDYSGLMPFSEDETTWKGLYSQSYTDKQGNLYYLASSQNEPFGARLIVPCFDEPQFKAVWKVTIVHPRGTTALSNAMEIERRIGLDWTITSFDNTPQMSSYLLALAIVNYKYKEGSVISTSGNRIRVRVWMTPELIDSATEPLENAVKLISYYEEQLSQPYPLAKMDMIEVQNFDAGAMENWGLIIYGKSMLARSFAVSHELAHQWFGNLVKYYGELNIGIFKEEGVSSHPRAVHYEPVWPEDYKQTQNILNPLYAYYKGASAIRTIELAMGSKEFYEGIKLYLQRYKFRNADYHDLLNTLSEAKPLNQTNGGPKSVAEFAETWILQPGYPVVTVKRHNTTHVELTQKPREFENFPPDPKAKWWIPIFYKADGKARPMEWLYDTLHLKVGQDEALILNEDTNVLYCENYDNETLNAVKERIKDKKIFPWSSLQKLIENSIVAANVNCSSYDSALELLAEVFKHRLDDLKSHFAMAEAGQKLESKSRFTKGSANRGYYENFKQIDEFGSVMNFMQRNRPNYVNERQRY